ncbi:MAG: phage tail assembly protein [Hyphomicrobiales bacterium]|nr:phage tail assembly protein [Hyphomicrobiales bacterium]
MADFKLSRPVQSHKGELETVTLREIKARDLFDLGEPVEIERETKGNYVDRNTFGVVTRVKRNMPAFSRYIERLSGLDFPTVGALAVPDVMAMVAYIEKQLEEAGDSPLPPASSSSSPTA